MIEFSVNDKRRSRIAALSEILDPPTEVVDLFRMEGRLLVPVRYATALYDWLREGHAMLGLGFHDSLWNIEQQIDASLWKLRTHPAMSGHGLVGRRNVIPMSCWKHDEHETVPMCNIDGDGIEGYLVPQSGRFDGSLDYYTFWTFVEMPHGAPRPRQGMFRPQFRNESRSEKDSFAAKKALDRKARLGF